MNTPNTRKPSEEAIRTAIRNAAKMWDQGYTVRPSQCVPSIYFVTKPNGATYLVDTAEGWKMCECEQFKLEGVCKHQRYVAEWRDIEEGELNVRPADTIA